MRQHRISARPAAKTPISATIAAAALTLFISNENFNLTQGFISTPDVSLS
jgi:hypothetical protein